MTDELPNVSQPGRSMSCAVLWLLATIGLASLVWIAAQLFGAVKGPGVDAIFRSPSGAHAIRLMSDEGLPRAIEITKPGLHLFSSKNIWSKSGSV